MREMMTFAPPWGEGHGSHYALMHVAAGASFQEAPSGSHVLGRFVRAVLAALLAASAILLAG